MTEYVLPFTCKQAEKVLKIFFWIGLIVFPCVLIYSWITDPNPVKEINADTIHDYGLYFGLLGSLFLWSMKGILIFLNLAINDKLPSFRCKCEDEQPSDEAVQQ